MEIENCNNLINIEDKGSYCSLHSPMLQSGIKDFRTKRRILTELRKLERQLNGKYSGWNAYTKTGNTTMMRIFWKLGAKPYHMDLNADSIWFFKKFQRG
jgi:hypothetical protein